MGLSNCINCGQCLLVCPTAALTERVHFSDRETFFHDPNKKMIALYSTSVAQTISDEFGIKPGKDITGIITAILRKIGFDIVINSGFGTDILIMEQAKELVARLKNGGPFPMFSSCCQAWVKYLEQFKPELLPNISTTKSAQQIMGSLIKTYFAEKHNLKPDDIYTAAIMPCTAKKYEAMRPEMTNHGVADIDAVITTRELIRMIRMYGIDVASIEPEPFDSLFAEQSSVGKLVNVSGGTAEAILRTAHFLITKNEIASPKLSSLRGSKPVKYCEVTIDKETIKIAAVNGMSNIKALFEDAENPFKNLHYIEVMACPGGCIAGGGQPKCSDETIAKLRAKAIYDYDEKETNKAAHKNKTLLNLYEKYLGEPLDPKYYPLLHTTFSEKQVLL
jgi:NADH-quinone oxidoreductase subunit G/NADP-reducing hydrogenase subunit HndD